MRYCYHYSCLLLSYVGVVNTIVVIVILAYYCLMLVLLI